MIGTPIETLKSHRFSKKKQIEVDEFLKIEKPTEKDFLELLNPSEIEEITNTEYASKINELSQSIRAIIDDIVGFIRLILMKEKTQINNEKSSSSLNVKQQIIILHYLFTFFRDSKTDIPTNKLSILLSKVLGRNSETLRGLLTQIRTVRNNEDDNKISKTPKNLKAVSDLLNSINLPAIIGSC